MEEELLEVSASQYLASLILGKALISLNLQSEYVAVNVEEMSASQLNRMKMMEDFMHSLSLSVCPPRQLLPIEASESLSGVVVFML